MARGRGEPGQRPRRRRPGSVQDEQAAGEEGETVRVRGAGAAAPGPAGPDRLRSHCRCGGSPRVQAGATPRGTALALVP